MAGALRIIAVLSVLAGVLAVGIGRLPQGARADDTIQVETRAVVPGPPKVTIDIEPCCKGNAIILAGSYLGVVPVAIITTPEFDATTVDRTTVVFAGAAAKSWEAVDVDRDGDKDLLLTFKIKDTNLAPGDTEDCLDGETYGGAIHACDSVRVIGLDWLWKPITADAGAIVLDDGAGDNVSGDTGQTAALGASSAAAALPAAGSSGFALWGDGRPSWVGLALGVVVGALIVGGVGWVFAGKRRNGSNGL